MQNTQETSLKTNFFTEKLFTVIKWLLMLIIMGAVYKTFHDKHSQFSDVVRQLSSISLSQNVDKFLVLFALIFCNWGCEAKKWQILAQKVEQITFTEAFWSVLMGLSLGFITPANLGDFAGRVWRLQKANRVGGMASVLLGNGIQFYVTLLFGVIAYAIFFQTVITDFDKIVFSVLIFVLLLGAFIFAKSRFFYSYLVRKNIFKKYQEPLSNLLSFDNQHFWQVFFWSSVRFIIISYQFVLTLEIFKIQTSILNLWAVSSLILMFKTIVPALNFVSDLGVREFSAIHYFSFFEVNISAVMVATLALWLINILFPVVVGSFLLLKIKK
ncbi:MAG: flippase-like domain-containing protein [Arcicella sp.]|nr:flippase-like domain-containing protein [Arcicella sp.]